MLGMNRLMELFGDQFDKEQFQPNGIDLRVKNIEKINNQRFVVGINKKGEKVLPFVDDIKIEELSGVYNLKKGETYKITLDNVDLPDNVSALLQIRSTFNRCGVQASTSVVDRGYCGPIILTAYNPIYNWIIKPGERFIQMVCFEDLIDTDGAVYNGSYQNNNIYEGDGRL